MERATKHEQQEVAREGKEERGSEKTSAQAS